MLEAGAAWLLIRTAECCHLAEQLIGKRHGIVVAGVEQLVKSFGIRGA